MYGPLGLLPATGHSKLTESNVTGLSHHAFAAMCILLLLLLLLLLVTHVAAAGSRQSLTQWSKGEYAGASNTVRSEPLAAPFSQ
jgi:hypothetical protein